VRKRVAVIMTRRYTARLVCLAACLAMTACAAFPDYKAESKVSPEAPSMDNTIKNATGDGFGRGEWPAAGWWRSFHNDELTRLIEKALKDAPDMRIASARIRLAERLADITRSGALPQVSAGADVTHNRISENGLIPVSFVDNPYTQAQLFTALGYDLTWWGENRPMLKSRLDEVRASRAEKAQAELILSAAVARTYNELQRAYTMSRLADEAVENREETRRLIHLRVEKGLETRIAEQRAETVLAASREMAVNAAKEIDVLRNQLAALTGEGPDAGAEIPVILGAPAPLAFDFPENLKIDLIARRPDITALRWRAEAAGARVDAAKTRFYPNINLTALVGLQSIDIGKILNSGSAIYSAGPAVHIPLFDGGRLRAGLGASYAEHDMAVESYNKSLIYAAKEIADNLYWMKSIRRRREINQQAMKAAKDTYKLTTLRYEKGLDNILPVLGARYEVLAQRVNQENLESAYNSAWISLVKSLGGGYQDKSKTESGTDHGRD